ncbi:MAG: hypothetical protein CL408_04690 [Acidimicrobiaceae bacterium]|nr:hypothetical protein [Acidimicrobiaceae bacterium]
MHRLLLAACGLVALLPACTAGGTSAEGVRTVVVLSADQATQIVVPAGFGEAPTTTSTSAAPESSAPESVAPESSAPEPVASSAGASSEEATASETTVPASSVAQAGEASDEVTSTEPVSDDVPTTSTTSTSTVAPVKETIPLAEEDINPGLKLMGALDDFNTCLAAEGYQWIGFPNADLGANDPVNQPGYLEALQFCNSRTGIANAYQDFQTSRSDMAPDEIRQANEDFIELADCLRTKGWEIGELRPDENGLLSPGDQFSSADGDIDTDEIRDCISEIGLERAGEE